MRCDSCSRSGPTASAEFRHNVGLLFARREYATSGAFCRPCLRRAFRHHTLRNVTLGWWGTLSFVLTWVFLVGNVVAYVRARHALGAPRAAGVSLPAEPASGEAALRLLTPFEHNVRLRLREGEDEGALAADLARVHGVTRASAEYFVETVSGAERSVA